MLNALRVAWEEWQAVGADTVRWADEELKPPRKPRKKRT